MARICIYGGIGHSAMGFRETNGVISARRVNLKIYSGGLQDGRDK